MIQKRSCILSTKIIQHFYDMVKTHVKIMQNVNDFTIYESLFQNFVKLYQQFNKIKLKCLQKTGSAWFDYISKLYQLYTSYISIMFRGTV